jgi:lysophospholipase L1-like esterase
MAGRRGPVRRLVAVLAGAAAVAAVAAGIFVGVASTGTPDGPPRDRLAMRPPLAPGPVAIAVIGTSLTLHATWPEALAEALQACSGRTVTLRRLARAGANAVWGRKAVARMAGPPPDLAIIEFAINDADLLDGTGRKAAADNTGAIVATLRAANPRIGIVLFTTNPVAGLQRLKRPLLERHYADYRRLAEALDLGLVDGRARWRGAGRDAMRDGVHPLPEAEAALVLAPILTVAAQSAGIPCPDPAGTDPGGRPGAP